MLEKAVFMVSVTGISIPQLIQSWEQAGLFSYILPFLVIFAIIFGLLERLQLFGEGSKGVNAVIATSVGLLSLQFGFVSQFFAQLFPRFGIGVAILLVAMIFLGMFIENKLMAVFFWVGAVVGLGILGTTFKSLGWIGGNMNIADYSGLILIGGLILLIYSMTSKDRDWKNEPHTSPLAGILDKARTK